MKRTATLIGAVAAVGIACTCSAQDFAALRAKVLKLEQLTTPPAYQPAEGFESTPRLKAIYYDALPWRGKPTKVFAWLGMPQRDGKVPGIVLVHGGGGTAFKEWVEKWTEHGYAAISIAVEGQTDRRDPNNPRAWERHPWGGPARVGIYGDSDAPLEDQWMYHAVADTILANSLMRSLPEVDADKVGLMGISWGGVITSTVIGIDQRFAFAIPVYGCGHLADIDNQYGAALGNNALYQEVWDPMVRLDRATMPVLWFSWPEDQHFALDCQARCYRKAPGPHMVALVPGMRHGHSPGWIRPESYVFADAVLDDGKPWCVQVEAGVHEGTAFCRFAATRPLDRAELVSTTDTGFTGTRRWNVTPATLVREGDVWKASAALPPGTTAWFINVASNGVIAGSDFQETQP
ncbi:hypothetical protein JCM19992_01420 [Thermostilla marina]